MFLILNIEAGLFLFFVKLTLAMCLDCSYFSRNLSLNVLINMVLTQEKACIRAFLVVTHDSIRGCVRPSVRRSVRR